MVSRAYYAAFLEARIKVSRFYPEIASLRTRDVHAKVRQRLKWMRHSTLSDELLSLFRKRGRADYDLASFDEKTVQKAITESDHIIERLARL